MSPIRFRDDEPSMGSLLASITFGALAGFAVGVVVAQKVGGLSGIASRVRARFSEVEDEGAEPHRDHHDDYVGEYGEDELEAQGELDTAALMEEQVLDTFERDPVLRERAIDITAVGDGVIELSGWVNTESESRRAEAAARQVDGVDAVVNRLSVGDDITRQDVDDTTRSGRTDTSEPISGGQWEGIRMGTGRRRQGSSDEPDRHADPKPELEDRWLDEEHAIEEAAGDVGGTAERRRRTQKPLRADRTAGGPIAPGGVPKGDHVMKPEEGREVDPNI
jgi:hypothetical protein